jgi:hypothetical protein
MTQLKDKNRESTTSESISSVSASLMFETVCPASGGCNISEWFQECVGLNGTTWTLKSSIA